MSLVEALIVLAIAALAIYVFVRSPKAPRGQPSSTQSPFFGSGHVGESGGGGSDRGGSDGGGGGGGDSG